ncbi:MAG: hypothetical protein ACI9MS_002150 [Glaciecola sp.]|jgi:hypothetical protein
MTATGNKATIGEPDSANSPAMYTRNATPEKTPSIVISLIIFFIDFLYTSCVIHDCLLVLVKL